MVIKIVENTKWETYKAWQFGLGLVSKRSNKTSAGNYDGDAIFCHKMSELEDLTDEKKAEIQKDCEELVRLLKKFYYEDDYVETNE